MAIALVVLMGVAALAIDISTWYQKHHNAQVAADAAALAAANCLANSSTTNTGANTCTSSTDTNAQIVATSIASANGYSNPSVTIGSSSVTVSVSSHAATMFAGFQIGPAVGARAVAAFTIGSSTACTTIGPGCYSVFAMGTGCTNAGTAGSSGAPIYFSGQGDTISGVVHSNGTYYEQGKNQTISGSATYGSGCNPSISSGSTSPTVGSTTAGWPANYYATQFSACSGSSCTGPCPVSTNCSTSTNHTPSYCNYAATSYAVTTALSSGVYCVVGTGSPNDPSTYTGLFQDQTSTAQNHVTVLAGAWQCTTSGCAESADGTYPVICAASTNANSGTGDGVAVDFQTQAGAITGPIFAPNGTIEWNGNGSNGTFLEAQQIYFAGGSQSILGDGPTGAQSTATLGSDNLTQ